MIQGKLRFKTTSNQYETFQGGAVALHVPRYCSLRLGPRSIELVAGDTRLRQVLGEDGVTTVECDVGADARRGATLLQSSREYGDVFFNERDEEYREAIPVELFGRVEGELYVEVRYRDWFDAEDVSLPTVWAMEIDGRSEVREGLLSGAWLGPEFEFVLGDAWRFNAWTPYFCFDSERRGQSLVVSVSLRNWAPERPAPRLLAMIRAKGQRRARSGNAGERRGGNAGERRGE